MISPGVGESYADGVAAIYRDAELRILNRITTSLEQGIDAPGWEQLQLARIQQVRDAALAELQASNPAAAAQIRDSIEATYNDGVASPYRDLGLTLDPLAGATMQRRAAVDALSADVVNGLASAQPAILRQVDDVYRSVIADATASVLAGGEGRKEATQRALNNLLSRGLDGVPTARGTISLPNYATMAVRTATARAAIDGHTASMGDIGLDLVVVRPGPRACPVCDAWAGKILTRKSTYSNPVYVPSLTDPDKTYTVQVYGTLSGAREAGWGHPNCRCGIAAYMPGTAASENLQRPSYNREEYEAQQQQRALERQIRAWKQREAIALTPEAKADSRAKVEAWQQQMRDHLDAHPYLKRQSSREQITGTLSGNAAAAKNPPRPTTSMPSKPSTKPKQPGGVDLTTPKPASAKPTNYTAPSIRTYDALRESDMGDLISNHYNVKSVPGWWKNPNLGAAIKVQGFDGLPTLVDSIDDLGPGERVYRVLADQTRMVSNKLDPVTRKYVPEYELVRTAKDLADDFKTGNLFVGSGIYGGGTYMGDMLENLEQYAGGRTIDEARKAGALIEAAIDPAARILKFQTRQEYVDWVKTERPKAETALNRPGSELFDEFDEQQISIQMLANGYDGFSLPAFDDPTHDERYTIMLNRTALRVVR